MIRLITALVGVTVLTLGPVGYKFVLHSREPADFTGLTARLDQVSLSPPGWEVTEDVYEFDDHWRDRLDLHHHRSAQLVSPEGRRINVLVMLSETGEQLYHTPDICYAAIGCEVSGDPVSVPLASSGMGDVRTVRVVFNQIGGKQSNTAAYGYWTDAGWTSPPQRNILNTLGREPFLLKVQILVENASPEEPETQQALNAYFTYLGEQLRKPEA